MDAEKVRCGRHGDGMAATFTCQHIAQGSATQFLSDELPTEAQPWPDAYCEQCEAFRNAHGGEWNDTSEAFANVKVLCSGCYEERRTAASGRTAP